MNMEEELEVVSVSCSPVDDVHVITRGISSLPLYLTLQVRVITWPLTDTRDMFTCRDYRFRLYRIGAKKSQYQKYYKWWKNV